MMNLFRKHPTIHIRTVFGGGPDEYTYVPYQEVSLWDEFLAMFGDKDGWRYVIKKADKYLFIRSEHKLLDTFDWEYTINASTMFSTYNEASTFEERAKELDKKSIISIMILRPTTIKG